MKIEIISKESIKPSSPTPPHLNTFSLCLLDQLVVDPYVPVILYYPNENGTNILQALQRSLHLNKSLSETLTQFYPLAGTIKNDLFVDCNDVGAYFVTALVHGRLDEFLRRPDHALIDTLLPIDRCVEGSGAGARVTNVQVNVFECGGMAIALCISHRVADGAAVRTFLKGWTNMAIGDKEVVYPNLTGASLFPAIDSWLKELSTAVCGSWVKEGKCSTKRFVFDAGAIASLKSEAARNGAQNPTRVEVVSALIWKCAMAASKESCGFQKLSILSHMVNLRRRLPATLSKDFMCNMIWFSAAMCGANIEITLHDLVNNLRESITKIDTEFVNRAQGEKGYIAMQECYEGFGEIGSEGSVDSYVFTSWCKMGFYEIDFGWGKPSWVSGILNHGRPGFMNFVTLMDTKCGEGVEAWVELEEEEMEILQGNEELLTYASLDPSPLLNDEFVALHIPNDEVVALHIAQDKNIQIDPIK